jgi:hypothetical protein
MTPEEFLANLKNLKHAVDAGTDLNDLRVEIRVLLNAHAELVATLQSAESCVHALVDIAGDEDDSGIHDDIKDTLWRMTGHATSGEALAANIHERNDGA